VHFAASMLMQRRH